MMNWPIQRKRPIVWAFVLAALPGLAGSTVSARPAFPNPVFEVGHNPWMLVRGDFNGDGKADLAVNDAGYDYPELGGVSLLLGRGDGSFSDRIPLATQNKPASLQICDLNSDGKTDLIVSYSDASALSVFLGQGDGTFGQENILPMTFRPFRVAAADFDADGRMDLAVSGSSNTGQGFFQVLLGTGDGSLHGLPPMSTGSYPGRTESADFNRDGRADLMIATFEGGLREYLGLGDGRFATGLLPPGTQSIRDFLLGDFNADGQFDLATDRSSVLLGRGDGTFLSVPLPVPVFRSSVSVIWTATVEPILLSPILPFSWWRCWGRETGPSPRARPPRRWATSGHLSREISTAMVSWT